MTRPPSSPLRRRELIAIGAASLGAIAAPRPAVAAAVSTTVPLTSQTTEGPYYFDPKLQRADIAEGRPGVPLAVRFIVTDVQGRPLAGARVDIWHCDAVGLYSGYAGQGDDRSLSTRQDRFLRGMLQAGADGSVEFRTVYPGWYDGRAPHIHFKVHVGPRTVLTSQCFLPDALSEYIYTQVPAYRRMRPRATLNRTDGIALEAGETVYASVQDHGDRYVLTQTAVVDPSAEPPIDRPPPPPDGVIGESAGHRPPQHGDGPPGGEYRFGFGPGPGRPPADGPGPDGRRGPPPGGPGERVAPTGTERVALLVPGGR